MIMLASTGTWENTFVLKKSDEDNCNDDGGGECQ